MRYWFLLIVLWCHALTLKAAPVEILFWHSFSGQLGRVLNHIVDDFNQTHPRYHIITAYKGEYIETLTAFAAAYRAQRAPAMVQVFEVGSGYMRGSPDVFKPLSSLLSDANLPLDETNILPELRSFYGNNGSLIAMPLNSSVPVIYYNKAVLQRVGVNESNFPKSWQALEGVIAKLRQSGFSCGYTSAYPVWIQIESFSALHGLPLLSKDNHTVLFNNTAILHHLTRLKHWQDTHYFEYGGRVNEATALFTSGRCPIFSQSSGSHQGLTHLVSFKLGVAPMPLDETVSTTRYSNVIGGAAIWVTQSQSPEVYLGIAHFIKYFSSASVQARWYQQSGYIPLGVTGVYEPILKDKINPMSTLLHNELSNLSTIQRAIAPLNQIRRVNDDALEAIFSNLKTPEEALAAAEYRANQILERFRKTHPSL